MKRQFVAASAGFCVACVVWFLVKSDVFRVPDIHVTFGNTMPDSAEPIEPDDPALFDSLTKSASSGVVQFASLHSPAPPELGVVKIGTAPEIVTLPAAPAFTVIMLVDASSTLMTFTVPKNSKLQIKIADQIKGEFTAADPAKVDSFSFSQPGDYSLDLTTTGNNEPAKYSVVVVNAAKKNDTYTITQPRFIQSLSLTAGLPGAQKTLNASDKGVFVSDGPKAKLTLSPAVVTSAAWRLTPGVTTTISSPADLVHSGKYIVTLEGILPSAFVDGKNQTSVDTVSTQEFELQTVASAASFEPVLLGLTQDLDLVPSGTAVFETLPENLIGASLRLNNDSINVHVKSPPAGRDIGLVPGKATEVWTTPTLSITKIAPGPQSLRVGDVWAGANGDAVTVNVIAPTRAIDRPKILSYSETKTSGVFSQISSDGVVKITGKEIHLSGIAPGATEVELLVLNKTAASAETYRKMQDSFTTTVNSQGLWNVDVSIVGTFETERLLVAVATGQSTHRYSQAVKLTTLVNEVGTVQLGQAIATYKSPLSSGSPIHTVVDSKFIGASAADITVNGISAVAVADKLVAVAASKRFEGAPATSAEVASKNLKTSVSGLKAGKNEIRLFLLRGSEQSTELTMELWVVDSGPKIVGVEPVNFGTAPGRSVLRIRFSQDNPLEETSARELKNYVLIHSGGQGAGIRPTEAVFDATRNEVALKFVNTTVPFTPDVYELRINGHIAGNTAVAFGNPTDLTGNTIGIRDRYENLLDGSATGSRGSDYSHVLSGSGSAGAGSPGDLGFPMAPRMALSEITAEEPDLLTQQVGLPETSGPPVEYLEFTEPRKEQNGFNPSDKVVSRVARTYYFRDAHRMVQIINRRVKSYNAQNATMARQLADKARLFAEQTIDRRQEAERGAVNAAGYARQAQNMISRLQSDLQTAETNVAKGTAAVQDLRAQLPTLQAEAANPDLVTPGKYPKDDRTPAQRLSDKQAEIATFDAAIQNSQQDAALFRQRSSASISALDALRERELEERETMNREQAKEDRAIDHQFRLEVQAAHTDPDTYAPGIPDSDDPVAQVSMSVIGEGLIQMRGPLKGVNIIHTMINEIDSPVGQVRVGVHTIQINGEKGLQMEEVAGRIQRYTDHSRFLTTQSTQMLRNAVSLVASRKAEEYGVVGDAGVVCEDGTIIPADANGMQVVGMNGMPGSASLQRYQDAFFGAEFMGQLRAMDSEFVNTGGNKLLSLNSMDSTSLASSLFLMALASNQTRMEILKAFQQSTMYKLPVDEFEYFEASDTKLKYNHKKFKFMADNARFVSLRGFFDSEIVGDNTLNPGQREFIKLAQILKSRLITEIELKQRVVERALIEERVGNYEEQLKDAVARERVANNDLKTHQTSLRTNLATILGLVNEIDARAESERQDIETHIADELSRLQLRFLVDGNTKDLQANEAQISALNKNKDLPQNIERPDARSTMFSRMLSLPEAWHFQAKPETLNKAAIAVEDARSAANKALLDDDYQGFLDIVFNFFEQLTRLAKLDPNPDPIIKQLLANPIPGADDFASINIRLSSEVLLKLTIQRRHVAPGTDPIRAYRVTAEPDGLAGFRAWVEQKASEIKSDPIATGLPVEFNVVLQQELASAVDFSQENELLHLFNLVRALKAIGAGNQQLSDVRYDGQKKTLSNIVNSLRESASASISNESNIATRAIENAHKEWVKGKSQFWGRSPGDAARGLDLNELNEQVAKMDKAMGELLQNDIQFQFAAANAQASRRPLDHKKFLDMLIDETEEKHIQLLEGTRAHTAVIDDYVKRICTALEDDFNTQFYEPAFRQIREQTYGYGTVSLGQIEHTTILTNNREFAKVQPQATMEFDLPRRRIMVAEAMGAAQAAMNDYGALLNDPSFLALTKLNSGQSTAATHTGDSPNSQVRDVLPGLPSQSGESAVIQARSGEPEFASQLEALIPDPAIYKFETGTGFEIRPVIQPDGQSVVFDFNYMYTTNIREPVSADEKHLGRVKRHFIDTDVQIGNYELREVSRYRVALKAERSGRGVPLLEDIPVAGALFRPMNNGESSLQQNIILAQSVIYPTLFDLMGLRWAPAVADLNEDDIKLQEFTYRSRMRYLKNEVYDYSSAQVDEFLRIPQGERRPDLYRTQVPIPVQHPNGYLGPGNDQQDSTLQEGYLPQGSPGDSMVPGASRMPGSSGMPEESGMMIPPVDSAPLMPYDHHQGAVNPTRANPARSRVTPATHRSPVPTPATDGRSSNVKSQESAPGRVRLSDLRPPVSQESSDRQKMPPLKATPPRSNSSPKDQSRQQLPPRQTSERGSSPAQTKSSVPISRTATNSDRIPSGRATLDDPNNDSTSLKVPETKRSGWTTRIPGMSNSGK